jgi:hypothetical protein
MFQLPMDRMSQLGETLLMVGVPEDRRRMS